MKYLLLILMLVTEMLWAASTSTKIQESKKNLSAVVSQKKSASRRLSKIAKDIQRAEKEVVSLDKKIAELSRNQEENKKNYLLLKEKVAHTEEEFTVISAELEEKNSVFIQHLSEQFSIAFAMEKAHEPTRKSILSYEMYEAYKQYNTKLLASLRFEIIKLTKRKDDTLYLRNKTENKIKALEKRQEDLKGKKLAKKKWLKKLAVDEERYTSRLQKIVDKQNVLRSTLANLNILQNKEVEAARKRAIARKEAMRVERERKKRLRKAKALAAAKARKAKIALAKAKTKAARNRARLAAKEAAKEAEILRKKGQKSNEKIRKINSSYQKSKVYAYRGGKTISPLPGAKLIKKFGTYVDPIYKIKIFNESITLKAPRANAKVKNVLNGKVVFAGKSSMLGKVVVVAHNSKMHTVYAGLSKIAPTIHIGSKIRRGYVVGRVTSKLMFQATKNSKHINPLKLIRI